MSKSGKARRHSQDLDPGSLASESWLLVTQRKAPCPLVCMHMDTFTKQNARKGLLPATSKESSASCPAEAPWAVFMSLRRRQLARAAALCSCAQPSTSSPIFSKLGALIVSRQRIDTSEKEISHYVLQSFAIC